MCKDAGVSAETQQETRRCCWREGEGDDDGEVDADEGVVDLGTPYPRTWEEVVAVGEALQRSW